MRAANIPESEKSQVMHMTTHNMQMLPCLQEMYVHTHLHMYQYSQG